MVTRRISRFNHSCAPNCKALFDNLDNIRVIVVKTIKRDEEMTINYLPLDWGSGLGGANTAQERAQERRDVLKEDWGFHCMCPLCVLESSG